MFFYINYYIIIVGEVMKNTSYTQEIKEELLASNYQNDELKALLSGFVKANGNIALSKNFHPISILLRTENQSIAKKLAKAFEMIYQIKPVLSYSRKINLDRSDVFTISIENNVEEILNNLEVSQGFLPSLPSEQIKGRLFKFYLIGVFLAVGTVNGPETSNYHLQLSFSDEGFCDFILRQLLQRFKEQKKMDFKKIVRKTKFVLYLKKAEQICVFLTVIDATESRLKFENYRIERDFVNSYNRYQICENANYYKTIKTSREQLKNIEIIKDKVGFKVLDEKTRAVIELREKDEEYTLKDIANLLNSNYGIKISKSGVNHIFQNIAKIASKYGGNN